MRRHFYTALAIASVCMGCHRDSNTLSPEIYLAPPERLIEKLPAAFPPLSDEEFAQEWGRELYLGRKFARQLDLYRALTCFKRARFLSEAEGTSDLLSTRFLEIDYEIFFAYYIAGKYQQAIETFEASDLINVPEDFPVLQDLTITLYDAYIQTGQKERAYKLLNFIDATDPKTANELVVETALVNADFATMNALIDADNETSELVCQFLTDYTTQMKSVSKAQTLNAIFPGAGYLYVGQQKTALTSFIINALFIAASYQLFNHGYVPAAIITTSLEVGWYFGGINGAGLAAKEYNERLYEGIAKETLSKNRLFPLFMIQTSF